MKATNFYLKLLNDEWFTSLFIVVCGTGVLLGYFAYLFIG